MTWRRGEKFEEEIAVVQAFRPAVSGGSEGPHYIRSDFCGFGVFCDEPS